MHFQKAELTTENSYPWDGKADITIRCVSPNGVLGLPASTATATGINRVSMTADEDNVPVYNLAGQRVQASDRSVLISKGKKWIAGK